MYTETHRWCVPTLLASVYACHLPMYAVHSTWHAHTEPHGMLGRGMMTSQPVCNAQSSAQTNIMCEYKHAQNMPTLWLHKMRKNKGPQLDMNILIMNVSKNFVQGICILRQCKTMLMSNNIYYYTGRTYAQELASKLHIYSLLMSAAVSVWISNLKEHSFIGFSPGFLFSYSWNAFSFIL